MNKEDPVAWRSTSPDGKLSNKFACKPTEGNWVEPLYATPPKQWVGLTDEEHYNIKHNYHNMTWTLEMYGRAIEQALKDKNHLPLYADTKIPEDVSCKTHPDAPHGFDRNMSHSLDRYVCECEHWEPSEHWEPTDNETNTVKGLYKDDNDTGR
jgi:hypothetical protein